MAPPTLGSRQVNCGPDWQDSIENGRVQSLATPMGSYDVAPILAKLPASQYPDAFVALVDASWRNMPRNISVFKGPKVLLVADTHHLKRPISGMLDYLQHEQYDRIVFLYTRHHLPIFRNAGHKNVYWFPGLTFPHDDQTVSKALSPKRAKHLAFVGQCSVHHPRRTRILSALVESRLPLSIQQLSQRDALSFYGKSLIGLNASLNGDLNLRVFEILASGSLLLTDRLGNDSGLSELFKDEDELVTYSGTGELIERARALLATPEKAARIGTTGQKWFSREFNQAVRMRHFERLVMDGTPVDLFPTPEPKCFIPLAGSRDVCSTFYEPLQDLHRSIETVSVVVGESAVNEIPSWCGTLPRVQTKTQADTPSAETDHWLIASEAELKATDLVRAPKRVLVLDGPPSNELSELLGRNGYAVQDGLPNLFLKAEVLAPGLPEGRGPASYALLGTGNSESAFALAQSALQGNSKDLDALFVIAEVLRRKGRTDMANGFVKLALVLNPSDVRFQTLAGQIAR